MRYPSIKTIKTRLEWLDMVDDPAELAGKIRRELERVGPRSSERRVSEVMESLNKLLDTFGVEFTASKYDDWSSFEGLEYLNVGDTYLPTIIFDHRLWTWRIESWGDVVERFPNLYL